MDVYRPCTCPWSSGAARGCTGRWWGRAWLRCPSRGRSWRACSTYAEKTKDHSCGEEPIAQRRRGCSLSRVRGNGVIIYAPGRAHGHSYCITRSTNFAAVRLSVTISQPLVTLTKRAHRSCPRSLLQVEHGCLERGACSLWFRVAANKWLSLRVRRLVSWPLQDIRLFIRGLCTSQYYSSG